MTKAFLLVVGGVIIFAFIFLVVSNVDSNRRFNNFESELIEGIITDKYIKPEGHVTHFIVVLDKEHIRRVREETYILLSVGDSVILESTFSSFWRVQE